MSDKPSKYFIEQKIEQFRNIAGNISGATSIEYALIAAFLSIAILAAVNSVATLL